MKKVITLLLAVLMIFSLAACKNNSNEPSTSGEAFYDMPDFSSPVTAAGDTAKFTLQEMLGWVNNTKNFSFDFATTLAKAEQTVYDNVEMKDGEVVKENVQPLGLITYLFDNFDIAGLGDYDAADFEFYDSDKMVKVKEDKLPKTFMECVVTEVCFDLTDGSYIIRAAYVIDEADESSTYFLTSRLTYLGDNQYKLMLRGEDYGDSNGKEYVYITTETFSFRADDYKMVDGTYKCEQRTSLVYETTINVGNSDKTTTTLIQRSEVITVDIDVKYEDGVYTANREMIMKQSDESYDPDKATEIYRVTQKIEQKDGVYVLTERAKGADNNGNPVDSTQYVTFTQKNS